MPVSAPLSRRSLIGNLFIDDNRKAATMNERRPALILLLAAQPEGTSQIRLDEEARAIRIKLREADLRDEIQLVPYFATRPDDIMQGFQQHRPDVVHFSGHGTKSSELVMNASNGRAKPISAKAIVQLFKVMGGSVKAAVLNSCFSRTQAREIASYVDVTIGMEGEIGVEAAIEFAAAFYSGLGYGASFADSFERGRLALMLNDIPEENVPKLHATESVDASDLYLVRRHIIPLRKSEIARAAAELEEYPVGPILHVRHIPREIIDAFSDLIATSRRFGDALAQATAILREAIPRNYNERQIVIHRGRLPPFGALPMDALWTQVFSLAGLKSRRTVASFLITPLARWALERSRVEDVAEAFLARLRQEDSFND